MPAGQILTILARRAEPCRHAVHDDKRTDEQDFTSPDSAAMTGGLDDQMTRYAIVLIGLTNSLKRRV